MISHLLAAVSTLVDRIIFYGGTALSRTILPDLRLSEDIDLLSVGSRRDVAGLVDQTIRDYMEPRFGQVTADPWLASARKDTQACLFHVRGVDVQIQLIDGTNYTDWPTQTSNINQRYSGVPPVRMRTYTARSFVGAKTSAWSETTRNAPRDLYDLWALTEKHWIDADAARLFKKHGPTGGYPEPWLLHAKPPSENQWLDALRHQCIPQVSAAKAHETVTAAWATAVASAKTEAQL
ncbi:MAG: nucleotidyl transferase AbiEii/AbiGii toxin family protein [Propionibacteriaceae bacterium]|nr:nucleotidyl transferase AbiEii/AbiGii toxin family protein [Propionibacteriaceae bacterium]